MKFLQIRQHVLSIMNDSSLSAECKVTNILDFMCEHNEMWKSTWLDTGYCMQIRKSGPASKGSHDMTNWVCLYAKNALSEFIKSTEAGYAISNLGKNEAIECYGQATYDKTIYLIDNPFA
jgi:hypothetical protein